MFGLDRKTRHFKARLRGVENAIFDLSFNRAKLKMIREQMRQQYDRIKETVSSATAALELEKAKETKDQTSIDNLEKVIDRYSPDLQYLEAQLTGMDNAIDCEQLDKNGNPIGINQRIEAARVMKDMLSEYIKTL